MQSIEKWSNEYKREVKIFVTKPTITLDLWTKGYQWVKLNRPVIEKKDNEVTTYFIPSQNSKKLSMTDVKTIEEMRWNSFEQFKKRSFSVWFVQIPNEKWIDGICNCPAFFKQYICKHLVGLSIRLKLCKPPAAAKDVPIGMKRSRGRPKKSTKALIVD